MQEGREERMTLNQIRNKRRILFHRILYAKKVSAIYILKNKSKKLELQTGELHQSSKKLVFQFMRAIKLHAIYKIKYKYAYRQ